MSTLFQSAARTPLSGLFWFVLVMLASVTPVRANTNVADSAASPDVSLRCTVEQSILMALENNAAFRVQRLTPQIVRTREDAARSAFDPALSGSVSRGQRHGPAFVLQPNATSDVQVADNTTAAAAALTTTLPTGTSIELGGETSIEHPMNDLAVSRAALTVTQPLLNGFGTEPNLVLLRQTRLDTRISAYELRAFALSLVAEVEQAAWDYVLTGAQLDVFRESARLAEQQLVETRERIRVGKLAELEVVAAEAERALRLEGEIDAASAHAAARLRLIRLLNPARPDRWQLMPVILDEPVPPESPLGDVEGCITIAMQQRPDLNQARLGIERGDLELVKTRNGLLPKLDFFASLGRSGYASSFDQSVKGKKGDGYDTLVGVRLNYPLGNRSARADQRQAVLNREQAGEALTNLCMLAQEDVRAAWVEAERARQQVSATRATRALQQRKFEAETAKFREGKSTALLVAQAERDLLQSQIAVIRSAVTAITSRTELYHQEGSLLARRGIAVPEE